MNGNWPVTADVATVAATAIASDVTTSRGAGNDAINAVIITFPSRTARRRAPDIQLTERKSYGSGTPKVDSWDEY